ncbi:MAG: trypsin-like peptidase domain-containing protein [Arachnia propionica]|uniref:S1C family serine protease n=1 Tax=Arachnia propionica TaxID=1750 RepID=UPI00270D3971|nr:trypsin-like peptidase domain-containing protein [Arachnia propionica]
MNQHPHQFPQPPLSFPGPQQPVPTVPTAPRRAGIGATGIVALALLSAGIGAGASLAATQYLAPASPATQAVATSVVQASATTPDWAATAAAVQDAVVAIQVNGSSGSGQGSGVIIDASGHIVTNDHVVSGAGQGARIAVTIGDRSHQASVVGTDPSTDLAVIRLDDPPATFSVIQWGDSASLTVGQPVMAVGNPLGLSDTVTTGIISALNRPVTTDSVVTAAIQTNAAINPGNSGGALVDASGALIGITSSIASLPSSQGQTGNIGIGFAIPAAQVRYVAEQLIANGVAEHAHLGVTARDGAAGTQLGASIDQVSPGSAAADAGLTPGDLVTAVDTTPVTGTESLVALIRNHEVGQQVTLAVLRGGTTEEIRVTLGKAAT